MTQTPAQKLGVTLQPAAAVKPASPVKSKTTNFAAWKSALETSRAATGYDASSPIYGKTDLEVLDIVRRDIESYFQDMGAGNEHADVLHAHKLVLDLVRRKAARQLAGQTYKNSK